MPLTSPVTEMDATLAAPLLHTPPDVASVNDIVAPTHTVVAPPIAAGDVGTFVTVSVTKAAVEPQELVLV